MNVNKDSMTPEQIETRLQLLLDDIDDRIHPNDEESPYLVQAARELVDDLMAKIADMVAELEAWKGAATGEKSNAA
jgi:hypothetical protein